MVLRLASSEIVLCNMYMPCCFAEDRLQPPTRFKICHEEISECQQNQVLDEPNPASVLKQWFVQRYEQLNCLMLHHKCCAKLVPNTISRQTAEQAKHVCSLSFTCVFPSIKQCLECHSVLFWSILPCTTPNTHTVLLHQVPASHQLA